MQQLEAFTTCAACGGRIWHGRGRLVLTSTPDGRLLIRLEDGTKVGKWLELLPADLDWLADILETVRCKGERGREDPERA